MPLPPPRVAFVSGCNGVSGNAIVEFLIRQPKTEWSRIIVTSRTPSKVFWQDPRVEFIAIDFLAPVEDIVTKMQTMCQDVTHAYFTSYVHTDVIERLGELNVPLFENFLLSIDRVARSLQRVCLQTGGKHYGHHLGPSPCPARETAPRGKDHPSNFYYKQEDILFRLQAQRTWSWNVIRPGGIVGFTPGSKHSKLHVRMTLTKAGRLENGMSEALTLALYVLICKELGDVPRFPGNEYFYNAVDDDSYAPSLADMTIWATTHDHTKNEAFNHANGDTYVWKYHYASVCAYFGIDIPEQTEWPTVHDDGRLVTQVVLGDWAKDKKPVWERLCEKYGGNKEAFDWGTWSFFDWATGKSWPTIMSISKARKFGWNRYDDTLETWVDTFKAFENAGILPSRRLMTAGTVVANGLDKEAGGLPNGSNA
ncbi:hypothetical protein FDECE_12483 [Fusarium decemcellulare]|nr:hypothetical protein FDECE_12483 [Fusarium decemcellulare]